MRRVRSRTRRNGVAAVELAVLTPLLIILVVGVWEIGRLIQLQQIMNAAARDGARLASQAYIVSSTGTNTQIDLSTSSPNVTDTIKQYLLAAGINDLTGLTITFEFLTGDTTLTQPYQGVKNQRFRIRVTMPYDNLRWTNLTLISPSTIGGECVWQMMTDDPFTLSTTLPGWTP
jgi:Flp pilus assembly protein TadG